MTACSNIGALPDFEAPRTITPYYLGSDMKNVNATLPVNRVLASLVYNNADRYIDAFLMSGSDVSTQQGLQAGYSSQTGVGLYKAEADNISSLGEEIASVSNLSSLVTKAGDFDFLYNLDIPKTFLAKGWYWVAVQTGSIANSRAALTIDTEDGDAVFLHNIENFGGDIKTGRSAFVTPNGAPFAGLVLTNDCGFMPRVSFRTTTAPDHAPDPTT